MPRQRTVTQRINFLSILGLVDALNRDMSNWNLDLDQGVRLVMRVGRKSLAVGTEVSVVADSTLVTIALDVGFVGVCRADGSITVDATMNWLATGDVAKGFVDRCKAMTRVSLRRSRSAVRAVVPIGAGETLVTNANNLLNLC
jgi:hypothetical protein